MSAECRVKSDIQLFFQIALFNFLNIIRAMILFTKWKNHLVLEEGSIGKLHVIITQSVTSLCHISFVLQILFSIFLSYFSNLQIVQNHDMVLVYITGSR